GADVVLDARLPCRRRGGGEEAAAAEARDAKSSVTDRARRCGHRHLGELLPPRRDPRHAGPGAGVDHGDEIGAADGIERPHGGGVEAQPRQALATATFHTFATFATATFAVMSAAVLGTTVNATAVSHRYQRASTPAA